jgi:hypothetical protein
MPSHAEAGIDSQGAKVGTTDTQKTGLKGEYGDR